MIGTKCITEAVVQHLFLFIIWRLVMYYVYLLKEKKTGKHYIGYTADLKRRLSEHIRVIGNLFIMNLTNLKMMQYNENED